MSEEQPIYVVTKREYRLYCYLYDKYVDCLRDYDETPEQIKRLNDITHLLYNLELCWKHNKDRIRTKKEEKV